MRTVTLRTLLREPRKVKAITQRGEKVQVTDKGKPLWIIQNVENDVAEAERVRAMDEILDEVLKEKPGKISMSKILDYERDDLRRLKLYR
jgi:hypothetical protein